MQVLKACKGWPVLKLDRAGSQKRKKKRARQDFRIVQFLGAGSDYNKKTGRPGFLKYWIYLRDRAGSKIDGPCRYLIFIPLVYKSSFNWRWERKKKNKKLEIARWHLFPLITFKNIYYLLGQRNMKTNRIITVKIRPLTSSPPTTPLMM